MKKIKYALLILITLFSFSSPIFAEDEQPQQSEYFESEYVVKQNVDGIDFEIQAKYDTENNVKVYVHGIAPKDLSKFKVAASLKDGIGTKSLKEQTAIFSDGVIVSEGGNFKNKSGLWGTFEIMPKDKDFSFVLLAPKDKVKNNKVTLNITASANYSYDVLEPKLEADNKNEDYTLSDSDLFGTVTPYSIEVKIDESVTDLTAALNDNEKPVYEQKKGETKVTENKNSNILIITILASLIIIVAAAIGSYIYIKRR